MHMRKAGPSVVRDLLDDMRAQLFALRAMKLEEGGTNRPLRDQFPEAKPCVRRDRRSASRSSSPELPLMNGELGGHPVLKHLSRQSASATSSTRAPIVTSKPGSSLTCEISPTLTYASSSFGRSSSPATPPLQRPPEDHKFCSPVSRESTPDTVIPNLPDSKWEEPSANYFFTFPLSYARAE